MMQIQPQPHTQSISQNDIRFIMEAGFEARKSDVLMQHGCVAVVNGKILGRGHNNYRTFSKDNFIQNACTCHAEIAALRNLCHTCNTNTYGKYSDSIKGQVA